MKMDNLAYRTAKKHVANYKHETSDLLAQHAEAMDCRDCEAFLQLGIDAFRWILWADVTMRQAIYSGGIDVDGEMQSAIAVLCKEWLGPCAFADKWISKQQELGYDLENLDKFRECHEEMRAMVEANEASADEPLPQALLDLRDQAIKEFLNGQTSEFI